MNRERYSQCGITEEEDGEGEEVLLVAEAEAGRETEEPGVPDRRAGRFRQLGTPGMQSKILHSPIEEREQAGSGGVSRVAMKQSG